MTRLWLMAIFFAILPRIISGWNYDLPQVRCILKKRSEWALQETTQEEPTMNRRDVLCRQGLLLAAGLVTALTTGASAGLAESTSNSSLCDNGTILPETPVPGAYQQVCMTLPIRRIPLQSTGDVLVMEQETVGAGSTGAAVWNAGLVLTRLLDRVHAWDPSWFSKQETVMELGCGAGLTSIALSKIMCQKGTATVLATDGNPQVVELAQRNAQRNKVDQTRVFRLQWGYVDAMDYSDAVDWVVGSDLTYNPGTWRALAETLSCVLKPGGHALYITLGHTGFQVDAELNGFLQVATQNDLHVVTAASDPSLPPFTKLLQECITPSERSVLAATGGVRLAVLQKSL